MAATRDCARVEIFMSFQSLLASQLPKETEESNGEDSIYDPKSDSESEYEDGKKNVHPSSKRKVDSQATFAEDEDDSDLERQVCT
jgi:hypothetical protein